MQSTQLQTLIETDRKQLNSIRLKVKERFDNGATGVQVISMMTEMMDQFIQSLIERSEQVVPPGELIKLKDTSIIIAVGGYGRGEQAPYSDIDLLFVSQKKMEPVFEAFVAQMVRNCWDAGLQLGHGLHTLPDLISSCVQDIQRATSLVETRLIWGSENLHKELRSKFTTRVIQQRARQFVESCIQERLKEREEIGAVIQSLQPDIKCATGGLRDIHLIRWLGFANHGTSDLEALRLQGVLPKEDAWRLRDAFDHFSQFRVDLHFHAGKAQDILTRDEQLRLSAKSNFSTDSPMRPVEQFMQGYFREAKQVAQIADDFIDQNQRPSTWHHFLGVVLSHRAEGIFLVNSSTIDILPANRQVFVESLENMLKLFELAAQYQIVPARYLLRLIKLHIGKLDQNISPQAAASFMNILHAAKGVGRLVRMLYDCELLFKLIPEFEHIRALLQFNHYHHYTVDEHTLRAIEKVEAFFESSSNETENELRSAYRSMKDREILHLTILLHDIGKGRIEDHSIVGAEMAQVIGKRLHLSQEKCDQISLLILKHLCMTDQALRRDISDPKTVIGFSHTIGDADTLTKLFVLSAADLSAVGPNVWTDWKADLLSQLYTHCVEHLRGSPLIENAAVKRVEILQKVRNTSIWRALSTQKQTEAEKILTYGPDHYFFVQQPEVTANDLNIVLQLAEDQAYVDGCYLEASSSFEYRIIYNKPQSASIFHKITGVLTARRTEIISADINVFSNNIYLNRFRVLDHDVMADSKEERIQQISREIQEYLTKPLSLEKLFKRNRRFSVSDEVTPISGLPLRVVIDNNTSEKCTVIDVFAHDRTGLLYTIAKTLEDLELSVSLAKIATHFDQAVDVFYVTDNKQKKISDPITLKLLRDSLEKRLDEFNRIGYKLFQH